MPTTLNEPAWQHDERGHVRVDKDGKQISPRTMRRPIGNGGWEYRYATWDEYLDQLPPEELPTLKRSIRRNLDRASCRKSGKGVGGCAASLSQRNLPPG
jgi:hypothetical protein